MTWTLTFGAPQPAEAAEFENGPGGLEELSVVKGTVVFTTEGHGGEGGMVLFQAEIGGEEIVGDRIFGHLVFSFQIVFGIE